MNLLTETIDGVAYLTLDRAPVNALDLDAILALEAFFNDFPGDVPLVIHGRGKAFCAGVDTTAFGAYDPAQKKAMILAITRMTAALLAIRSPVVGAVNGHALGGGFVIMLCTDYRIGVDTDKRDDGHKFGLTEARAGIPFPLGPTHIIRHELPPALLRQLTLSSRTCSARTLFKHCVVDELVAAEKLLHRAGARARELTAQPGFGVVKQQVRGELAGKVRTLGDAGADPLINYLGL